MAMEIFYMIRDLRVKLGINFEQQVPFSHLNELSNYYFLGEIKWHNYYFFISVTEDTCRR